MNGRKQPLQMHGERRLNFCMGIASRLIRLEQRVWEPEQYEIRVERQMGALITKGLAAE